MVKESTNCVNTNRTILECVLQVFEMDQANEKKQILAHVIEEDFVEFVEENMFSECQPLNDLCEKISRYLYCYLDITH